MNSFTLSLEDFRHVSVSLPEIYTVIVTSGTHTPRTEVDDFGAVRLCGARRRFADRHPDRRPPAQPDGVQTVRSPSSCMLRDIMRMCTFRTDSTIEVLIIYTINTGARRMYSRSHPVSISTRLSCCRSFDEYIRPALFHFRKYIHFQCNVPPTHRPISSPWCSGHHPPRKLHLHRHQHRRGEALRQLRARRVRVHCCLGGAVR